MKILVTGDIHAEFGCLNNLIAKERPELMFCCGDFGFWPNTKINQFDKIDSQGTKIFWCDGNHENHWELKNRKSDEIVPNVIYMPRGSIYTLPDDRNILFVGGGDSIDKGHRKLGIDWFPEEIISYSEYLRCLSYDNIKIDILISHTCSEEIKNSDIADINSYIMYDPCNEVLSQVQKKYIPKLWYFGHWHKFKTGVYNGTKWTSLSYPNEGTQWWIELEE